MHKDIPRNEKKILLKYVVTYRVANEKKNRPKPRHVTNPNIRCFFVKDGQQSFCALANQLLPLLVELDSPSLNRASSSSAEPKESLLPNGDFSVGNENEFVRLLNVDEALL